jgi:hypothetical protein
MRVNIHHEPIGKFNIHLPWKFYCNDIGPRYAEPFKKFQQAGVADITLVNNGEPLARLYVVHSYLAEHGIETKVELLPARYHKLDNIFNGKSCAIVAGAVPGCRELVEYYLDVYQQLDENINQTANLDVFYGFKKVSALYWYHYGLAMPETDCPLHLRIREMYDGVFWSYVETLSAFLGYTKQDVADRLILRMNHTLSGQYRDPANRIFLPLHWDTAVMTGNLYKNHPGLNIRIDEKMMPVEDFYDQEQETLLIPGIDYCDEFETMTDPTWHEVVDHADNHDRVSIVALLKRRKFRE